MWRFFKSSGELRPRHPANGCARRIWRMSAFSGDAWDRTARFQKFGGQL